MDDAIADQFLVAAPADHCNDGTHDYEYQALDNAGNVSGTGTCKVNIDTTNPTVTDNAPHGWSNSDVTVTLTASDTGSGVAKTQYRLASSSTWLDTGANKFVVQAPTTIPTMAPTTTLIAPSTTPVTSATRVPAK